MARAWEVPGLGPRTRFREAAGRVLIVRWREMLSHREGTERGEDVEALHAMRVSARRLRSAMDAFADAFPRKAHRRRLRMVKRVADTLGEARDLDVAIAELRALEPTMADGDRPGIQGLIARYEARRRAEDPRIRALFAEMDQDRVDERFVRWVTRHTGVDAEALDPRPPGRG